MMRAFSYALTILLEEIRLIYNLYLIINNFVFTKKTLMIFLQIEYI